MRVLVLGATGLLGRVLVEEWTGADVTGVGSREVDIRSREQLRDCFARCRPEWTVLAAAYTDVDGCESNSKHAHEVNTSGAENVALECREAGSRLLFVSTDYVFDGTNLLPYETGDKINPLSVYARSKAEGERRVLEAFPDACVVRTSWLFGANGRCFPKTILDAAARGKSLSVVDDQIGRPTYNRDLARAIIGLSEADARGTVHAANSGSCSWFEFACHLVRAAGFTDLKVEAIPTAKLSRPAPRPMHSVLSLSSLEAYGIRMRPWQDTVIEYMAERTALARMATNA